MDSTFNLGFRATELTIYLCCAGRRNEATGQSIIDFFSPAAKQSTEVALTRGAWETICTQVEDAVCDFHARP